MTVKQIWSLLGLSLVWTCSDFAVAAPPDVTSLFPAGAQRGASVDVTIQGKLGDGPASIWVSRPGVDIKVPDKPGPLKIDVAPQAEPGVYWLRFFNAEGASGVRPFVVGGFPEVGEVEPNDEVAKAQVLSESTVVVNGQHAKGGDADTYAMSLKKGQIVVASLMASRVIGSNQDAVLQVLGPNGFVLDQNQDDQGFDPQLAFTVPADGTYYLRTWALPMTPDSSIRLFGSPASVYRLTVTTGPFVDYVVPIAVQSGQPQRVALHGWNVDATPLEVNAPVSAISQRFAWPLLGWSHRLPATVLVMPYASTIEREPNDLLQSQGVELPMSITGVISQTRDVDVYRFVSRKGQRLRFEILARDLGSPLDAFVRLYDASGKILKEVDDDGKESADPDFDFTIPADGEYRITVADRFAHHGDRFVYLLNITEAVPDFALSVAGDAFVLKADKELEIPVTVNRLYGFSEPIEVQVNGLPPGVTAQPVKSEPKGDSAKSIKLKLQTTGEVAFGGTITIVGKSSGDGYFDRVASVSLKAFGTEISQLWLTVVATKKQD